MSAGAPQSGSRFPLAWVAKLSSHGRGLFHERAVRRHVRIFDGLTFAAPSPKVGGGRAVIANRSGAGASAGAERDALEAPLEGLRGRALSEEAFHWLLGVDLARADRAGRPLRLLLVSLKPGPRRAVPIEPSVAARLFAGLGDVVRETDVVGWYREDRVAGAVLVERADRPGSDACPGILQRVGGALRDRLPSRVARQLQFRVVRVRPRPKTHEKPGRNPPSRTERLND